MTKSIRSFVLGAYWSARKESVEECADRLFNFFRELTVCSKRLSTWHELANSKKEALEKPARVDSRDYLIRKLERARCSSEEVGFSFGLWNGEDEPRAASFRVSCGAGSRYVGNSATLEFPHNLDGPGVDGRMRAVLAAVVGAWEPDWAGVMSNEAMDKRDFDARKPFVDWMLYVSDKWLPSVPAFEPPASAERLAAGTIIIVQQEPPDPQSPAHLENIERIRATLENRIKAGT